MAIGPFYVGDIPVTPITIVVTDEGFPTDLSPYTGVDVQLISPNGLIVPAPLVGTIDTENSAVVLTWDLEVSPFVDEGIHSLSVALTSDVAWITLPAEEFVVQSGSMVWLSLEASRAAWRDAPDSDAQLYRFLLAASTQCAAFLGADTTVTDTHRLAQLMQTRDLWNASKLQPEGSFGDEGFEYRPASMSSVVRNMLRPRKGVPLIG